MDQQQQLIDWISHDKNFTEIFNILDRYHLTEATLCAGSIRELVWNKLENKPSSILRNNLDIYYNDPGESYEHYLTIQSTLNQAMHSAEFSKKIAHLFKKSAPP